MGERILRRTTASVKKRAGAEGPTGGLEAAVLLLFRSLPREDATATARG
jgi:hypothetical protein